MLARKMPISLLVTAICRAPLLGNAYPIEPEPTKFHLLDRTSLRLLLRIGSRNWMEPTKRVACYAIASNILMRFRGLKHQRTERMLEYPAMVVFARKIPRLALVMIVCCAPSLANAYPTEPEPPIGTGLAKPPVRQAVPVGSSNKLEPGALSPLVGRGEVGEERTMHSRNLGLGQAELSAKWLELQSRIQFEQETLAACRLDGAGCPAAARRFLSMVELGRQQRGRARLGEINRAVNLSIKPVSDLAQSMVLLISGQRRWPR